jgi:nucleotide-binding universal stress UspA family protein
MDLDDDWLMASLTPLYGHPLICYDGSEGAKKAVAAAAELLNAREAVVLAVWQPIDVTGSISWTGLSAGTINLAELNGAAEKDAVLLADEGVREAVECGLDARPLTVMASGPIWSAICEASDREGASVIVMGSRGLSGVRSMLMGSVSRAVLQHAGRPTLITHPDSEDDQGAPDSASSIATAS